jgi:hypothetical protein
MLLSLQRLVRPDVRFARRGCRSPRPAAAQKKYDPDLGNFLRSHIAAAGPTGEHYVTSKNRLQLVGSIDGGQR